MALALCGCGVGAALRGPRVDREVVRQLEHEVGALRERNRQLSAGTAPAQVAPHPIYAELQQVFTDTDVRVRRDADAIVVLLPATLLFSNDEGALRNEAALPLDLLATALQSHAALRVEVVGHTDDSAPQGRAGRASASNWERSFAWARAVQRALVERHGLDEQRFALTARADTQALASNDTPGGRAANRRVELWLRAAAPAP